MSRTHPIALTVALGLGVALSADVAAGQPRTTALSRSTTAVTYEARRTTTVDLVGTPLMWRVADGLLLSDHAPVEAVVAWS